MRVNLNEYYLNSFHSECGYNEFDSFSNKQSNSPYRQGDVVYVEKEQRCGVVLGVIDLVGEQLRLDLCGMTSFADIRLATQEEINSDPLAHKIRPYLLLTSKQVLDAIQEVRTDNIKTINRLNDAIEEADQNGLCDIESMHTLEIEEAIEDTFNLIVSTIRNLNSSKPD